MHDTAHDEFLMTSAAARLLGVAKETVLLWERQGKLAAIRTENGRRLFPRSDASTEAMTDDRTLDISACSQSAPLGRWTGVVWTTDDMPMTAEHNLTAMQLDQMCWQEMIVLATLRLAMSQNETRAFAHIAGLRLPEPSRGAYVGRTYPLECSRTESRL